MPGDINTASGFSAHVTDFLLQPPKSGFNTVRLEQVQTDCFSGQAHGATLGRILFGFWSQKSDNQWKVLRGCLTNLPTGGISGNQTFPRGCAPRECLITLRTSLRQIFQDNPVRLFTVCTTFWFRYFDGFWLMNLNNIIAWLNPSSLSLGKKKNE